VDAEEVSRLRGRLLPLSISFSFYLVFASSLSLSLSLSLCVSLWYSRFIAQAHTCAQSPSLLFSRDTNLENSRRGRDSRVARAERARWRDGEREREPERDRERVRERKGRGVGMGRDGARKSRPRLRRILEHVPVGAFSLVARPLPRRRRPCPRATAAPGRNEMLPLAKDRFRFCARINVGRASIVNSSRDFEPRGELSLVSAAIVRTTSAGAYFPRFFER
jgi:hypothetical protein